MAEVQNNSARPFHVGEVMLPPGGTAEVPDDSLPLIKLWVDAGELEVVKAAQPAKAGGGKTGGQ